MEKDSTVYISCCLDCNNINKNECKCNVTGEKLVTYNDVYTMNSLGQKVQPYFHNKDVCDKEDRKRLFYVTFSEDREE